jgi:uncharacterized protein YjbI with pentapeptide repeats
MSGAIGKGHPFRPCACLAGDRSSIFEIINPSALSFGFLPGHVHPSDPTLTLIVKGTYKLNPDQKVTPVKEQDQLPLSGDDYGSNPAHGHYRYESDFAPFKPRADLMLVGSCHTPGHHALKACPVTFAVGRRSKTLWAFGQRYWQRSAAGFWSMTDPEPFSQMPITYENSFGGPGYDQNPVGKGYIQNLKKDSRQDKRSWALPNIEDSGELVATPHSKLIPSGFGPLDRMWKPRVRRVGTLDNAWLKNNWPKPPADFDWGYFNAAPQEMQVQGYLQGDEELYFENLHARIDAFRTRLPGIRARCFVAIDKTDGGVRFNEVPMNLDTLWVDMPKERLVLVWRGVTAVRSADFKEIAEVLVVAEDLGTQDRGADFYFARIQADQAKTEQMDDLRASSDAQPKSPPEQDEKSTEPQRADDKALQALVDKGLNQARELLRQSRADPKLIQSLEPERDPEAFLNTLMTGLNLNYGQIDAVREQTKDRLRNLLSSQGEDPSIVEELFMPQDQAPLADKQADQAALLHRLDASTPETRDFSGTDLSGLDLSGKDLKGADFKGAALGGAVFRAADLSGADFSQASLEHADFSRAVLSGASFVQADLTAAKFIAADLRKADLGQAIMVQADASGADFSQADLSGAVLAGSTLDKAILREVRAEGADFTGARLKGADLRTARIDGALFEGAQLQQAELEEASGAGTIFNSADLADARLSKGCFANANFADARMDRARLENCDLSQATFERARATQVSMSGADLTGAKAGEGACFPQADFRKITAPRSIWTDADLEAADFSGGQLERADFSRARLNKARFRAARSRFANFDASILQAADFQGADLFMANLTRADMQESNLSGGNFYSAEFLNTQFLKTNIQGANLKMTKLAGR